MKKNDLSERKLAERVGLSRLTLRSILRQEDRFRVSSLRAFCAGLGRDLILLDVEDRTNLSYSAQAAGFRVIAEGEASWKIHFMDFVDEFNRTLDARLILLPPPDELEERLKTLLASMVCYLCRKAGMHSPHWASRRQALGQPWFVSESESLKAMMILESPIEFRRNLIFVGENFMERV